MELLSVNQGERPLGSGHMRAPAWSHGQVVMLSRGHVDGVTNCSITKV